MKNPQKETEIKVECIKGWFQIGSALISALAVIGAACLAVNTLNDIFISNKTSAEGNAQNFALYNSGVMTATQEIMGDDITPEIKIDPFSFNKNGNGIEDNQILLSMLKPKEEITITKSPTQTEMVANPTSEKKVTDNDKPTIRVGGGVPFNQDLNITMGKSDESGAVIEIFTSDENTGGSGIRQIGYSWDTTEISAFTNLPGIYRAYVNTPDDLEKHILYVYAIDCAGNMSKGTYRFDATHSVWEGTLKEYSELSNKIVPEIKILKSDNESSLTIDLGDIANFFSYSLSYNNEYLFSNTIYGNKCNVTWDDRMKQGNYQISVLAVNGIKYNCKSYSINLE